MSVVAPSGSGKALPRASPRGGPKGSSAKHVRMLPIKQRIEGELGQRGVCGGMEGEVGRKSSLAISLASAP